MEVDDCSHPVRGRFVGQRRPGLDEGGSWDWLRLFNGFSAGVAASNLDERQECDYRVADEILGCYSSSAAHGLRLGVVGLPRRYRDGMPVVEFHGVVALLGRFPALTGLDLTVKSGETVLLQGPNGSGKSTLLRLCAGLVRPIRGEARVLDCDLTIERQSVRRRVGLLSHAGGL